MNRSFRALAPALVAVFVSAPAFAQSDALDRSVLPIPEPPRPVYTELDARNATPPPRFEVKAPEGAPNVLIVSSTTWASASRAPSAGRSICRPSRRWPTTACATTSSTRPRCVRRRARALDRPQSSHEQHGRHYRDRHRLSRQHRAAPERDRAARRNAASQRLFDRGLRQEPRDGRLGDEPLGPTDRWPTRSGFDKFYGFIGGETNQWHPSIFKDMTPVEPPHDPHYHFMTDMTNQAIDWALGKIADARQAVLHLFRARRRACAAPRA